MAADKAYDSADFIADCRKRNVTPHVAMNITEQRDSAIDARTTRHPGYVASQRIRKRIEECFGWVKDGRPMLKMKVLGKEKVAFLTILTVGCYTLLRLTKLLAGPELAPPLLEVSALDDEAEQMRANSTDEPPSQTDSNWQESEK